MEIRSPLFLVVVAVVNVLLFCCLKNYSSEVALLSTEDSLVADARSSLKKAVESEMEAKNLKAALSGRQVHSPALRKLKNVKAKARLVQRRLQANKAFQYPPSSIEEEAREAGARALKERDPVGVKLFNPPTPKLPVLAQAPPPATANNKKAVKKSIPQGISNPRGFLHPDDRYVSSGMKLDHQEYLDHYLNPTPPNQTLGAAPATAEVKKSARQQQLAQSGVAPSSQPSFPVQLPANSPTAPVLAGGIPVPGGHIVWIPESALDSAADVPAKRTTNNKDFVKEPATSSHSPSQGTVSTLVLPLPVQDYSEVVAYGPDGHRELVWYKSQETGSSLRSHAVHRQTEAKDTAAYSIFNTGYPANHAESVPTHHARGRTAALSPADRRVERDLLLRLLSTSPGSQQTKSPGEESVSESEARQQQLAQVSAATHHAVARSLVPVGWATAVLLLCSAWTGGRR